MERVFDLEDAAAGQAGRLRRYLSAVTATLGHKDREQPFTDYCSGLLLPGERKSVEPIAAKIAPTRAASAHQSLLHLVGNAAWSDEAALQAVTEHVVPALQRHGPISAWIIDDTGMPKKGHASVGVSHQYCGNLGKRANCQVAVSLSVANDFGSIPVAYRLYLPKTWTEDDARRTRAKIPVEIAFATKAQIALSQIKAAHDSGIPLGVVVADAAYGNDTSFRDGVEHLGMQYCVSVQKSTTVWANGKMPLAPVRKAAKHGRPMTRLQRTKDHRPQNVEDVALSLSPSDFHEISWREGTRETLTSRFASVRVRSAHRDEQREHARNEEWLLIEWPSGEDMPRKYWLANLPTNTSCTSLVRTAQTRWRIERDYQELKDEIGLDHYEGRGWRGFHHHATLCITAYGFLVLEKSAAAAGDFSPCENVRDVVAATIAECLPARSSSYRPRGASGAC
jgi:SRSO17 transposase